MNHRASTYSKAINFTVALMLSLTIFVVSVYAGIFLPTSSMLMHAYGVLYGVYGGHTQHATSTGSKRLWKWHKDKLYKTKEMILSPLSDGSGSECVFIECVYHFKLLGINISHDMNWQAHIDAISHKAASRLHFLRIPKKPVLKPAPSLTFLLNCH